MPSEPLPSSDQASPTYNPLVLGQAYDSDTSLPRPRGNSSSRVNLPSEAPKATPQLPPGAEPAKTMSQDQDITGQTGTTPRSPAPSFRSPRSVRSVRSARSTRSTATAPALHHTRTAPTTSPIGAVVPMPLNDSDRSSSSTLNGLNGTGKGVSPIVGGLNGQPVPSAKRDKNGEINEKDHQAASVGGKTGPAVAALAAGDLGLNEKQRRDENESRPPKVERTGSGNALTHPNYTGAGGVVLPSTRRVSRPPAVGLFGGSAPQGTDHERGFHAVRTHEEEAQREANADKEHDPWSVTFTPGDQANPKNWSSARRWYMTSIAGLLVLNSTFASSAPSGIIVDMMKYFAFRQEIGILTVSLFVAGYCVGPLFWGPLSESYGRRPVFLVSFFFYTCFQVGCALSKNTGSILVFRFISGCFASAPLTNTGGLISDIWDPDHRGQALSLFALAPFAGPSVGPIVSGFIQVTGTDWRWLFWVTTMFAGSCLLIIIFTIPETYAPKILAEKAKKLRKETGEERWYAPIEKTEHSVKGRLEDILLKPFKILFLEPMLLSVTLYMSFIYGVVYLLFEAFPFVFEKNHGFNAGEEGLAFLGFFSGGCLGVLLYLIFVEPRYQRYIKEAAPNPPEAEKRLEFCIIGAWTLVISFFWFGWTSYPSIHWMSPVLGGGLIGFSVLAIFLCLFNYIIDTYLFAAASALAANTVCRSIFGAGFPLFAVQMYNKLGTQWATSLLGFLALAMAPIPLVLAKYGKTLRQKSRFSPSK